MVVACAALAVSLSGAGYAAIVLPKNSVGTQQLRRDAVRSSKIANNQVTGADINEATLGEVPAALNAQTAASADDADAFDGRDSGEFVGGRSHYFERASDSVTYVPVAPSVGEILFNCAETHVEALYVNRTSESQEVLWSADDGPFDIDNAPPDTVVSAGTTSSLVHHATWLVGVADESARVTRVELFVVHNAGSSCFGWVTVASI
jgi:hypothetical protein